MINPVSTQVSCPAYDDLGAPEPIEPLFPQGTFASLASWQKQRTLLLERWRSVLGTPSFGSFDPTPQLIDTFERDGYRATIFKQPTGPQNKQRLLFMEPARKSEKPRPGMVIPFYHPDAMAGIDLSTGHAINTRREIQFGRHLVEQGYAVLCTEAFPYNTVPQPADEKVFTWWQNAANRVLAENPNWTGMGKLIWDTRLAIDLLLAQPNIDSRRIGIMGHSLGGKIAFYTGILDERVGAIVSSDFGIGWNFTNWSDDWYLGPQIRQPNFTLAHHHLLALHAPRSFLLIGGEADRPASWQYLREAQKVYALHGITDAVGFFDHASGHSPTEESLRIAYAWLAERFGIPPQPWSC